MTTVHEYQISGLWSGDRQGSGRIDTDGLQTQISVPGNLGGPGIGTSPETLLLSAATSCYLITLAILLTKRSIPYVRLDITSKAFVENDGGLRFDRIEHYPTIVVGSDISAEQLQSLAEHAEHACMVSSALRGNVAVTVRPSILHQTQSV